MILTILLKKFGIELFVYLGIHFRGGNCKEVSEVLPVAVSRAPSVCIVCYILFEPAE